MFFGCFFLVQRLQNAYLWKTNVQQSYNDFIMCRKLLFFIFLLISTSAFSQQQLKLIGQLSDCKNEKFYLLAGDEGGTFVVDSATVSSAGELRFEWAGDFGFYRITGGSGFFDFRMTTSELNFSLTGKPQGGEIRFPDKDENNQLHYYLSEFTMLNENILSVSERLYGLNEKDTLYKNLTTQYKQLSKEKKNLLRDLWGNKIDLWPARFALASQELVPDAKLKGASYNDYIQKHFFDYFAFTDSLLTGTPVFYEKIGNYLKIHKIDELIEQGNIKEIGEVIGSLFWLSELEPKTQTYIANYLMNRYPEESYPQVYHTVADSYKVLNTCEYVLGSKTIQNRIRNSRENKPGWMVPDIPLLNSLNGKIQSLSDVNSELTLLVICSGSCIHSTEMLEQIKDLYYLYKEVGFEVVAFSLDQNLNFWEQTVYQNAYPWINACDTEGLNGSTANLFNVYVTPSMFLIDSSLKTIAVPQTFFQLQREVEEFFR